MDLLVLKGLMLGCELAVAQHRDSANGRSSPGRHPLVSKPWRSPLTPPQSLYIPSEKLLSFFFFFLDTKYLAMYS